MCLVHDKKKLENKYTTHIHTHMHTLVAKIENPHSKIQLTVCVCVNDFSIDSGNYDRWLKKIPRNLSDEEFLFAYNTISTAHWCKRMWCEKKEKNKPNTSTRNDFALIAANQTKKEKKLLKNWNTYGYFCSLCVWERAVGKTVCFSRFEKKLIVFDFCVSVIFGWYIIILILCAFSLFFVHYCCDC